MINLKQMKDINFITEDQARVAINTFQEESKSNKNVILPLMPVKDVRDSYWSEDPSGSTELQNSDSD